MQKSICSPALIVSLLLSNIKSVIYDGGCSWFKARLIALYCSVYEWAICFSVDLSTSWEFAYLSAHNSCAERFLIKYVMWEICNQQLCNHDKMVLHWSWIVRTIYWQRWQEMVLKFGAELWELWCKCLGSVGSRGFWYLHAGLVPLQRGREVFAFWLVEELLDNRCLAGW